jgi:hypothetical protein
MGRPVKDYWNWSEIVVPYENWYKDRLTIEDAELFLKQNAANDKEYEVRVSTDYPTPRKKWASKRITAYHFYIKDPAVASWFGLKYA